MWRMLKRNLSRRDFLKIAGIGLGTLAFRPLRLSPLEYLAMPKRLAQFPASEIIGRVTDPGIYLRSKPTNAGGTDNVIQNLAADTLLEWNQEVVGYVIGGLSNQKYVETPLGYVYGSVLQPTRNIPNTPITEIPAGKTGFWAEVTVPYVDLTHEGNIASPWLNDHLVYNFPPRLYYGQVVWMDRIRSSNGFIEYRWNEDANGRGYGYGGSYGEFFWGDGAGFKVLTDADVSTISPDVDPVEKTMTLNLDYQTLSCFEGNREVYYCRVSTGIQYTLDTTGEDVDYATPPGTLADSLENHFQKHDLRRRRRGQWLLHPGSSVVCVYSGWHRHSWCFLAQRFWRTTFAWLRKCNTRRRQVDFPLEYALRFAGCR